MVITSVIEFLLSHQRGNCWDFDKIKERKSPTSVEKQMRWGSLGYIKTIKHIISTPHFKLEIKEIFERNGVVSTLF